MQYSNRYLVVVLIVMGLQLSACRQQPDTHSKISPSHVEHIDGSELSRVTLTEKAMQRLDVKTTQVGKVSRRGLASLDVPYSAVLYDTHGKTWVYTSPEPRVFVRHLIDVDRIEGDMAFLKDGPPVGTEVVSVGAAEIFGAEFGVGH